MRSPTHFPRQLPTRPDQTIFPKKPPQLVSPSAEDVTARTAIYDALDSNVGAKAMAFTHTEFPLINSASSTRHLGHSNPTRPFRVVKRYLEDVFKHYLHLASFNTTVVDLRKIGDKWRLTLRQSGHFFDGSPKDYWWQEEFDAVVVASGHYTVPFVLDIKGLDEAATIHPSKFEHSKSFRALDDYVGQKVVVVGGNISAADLVADLYAIVKGPLELSQRGKNEALESA